MRVILWRFKVQSGKEGEFEKAYGPGGAWDVLFRRGEGFLGTELLRPAGSTRDYVTIDRWRSEDAFEAFLRDHKAAYTTLDAQLESLTVRESPVGTFSSEAGPPDRADLAADKR